jgi:hypothetical protein
MTLTVHEHEATFPAVSLTEKTRVVTPAVNEDNVDADVSTVEPFMSSDDATFTLSDGTILLHVEVIEVDPKGSTSEVLGGHNTVGGSTGK